jgi:hypothetical protein
MIAWSDRIVAVDGAWLGSFVVEIDLNDRFEWRGCRLWVAFCRSRMS